MDDTWLDGNTTRKDLGVLVNLGLNPSLHCNGAAQKMNAVLRSVEVLGVGRGSDSASTWHELGLL